MISISVQNNVELGEARRTKYTKLEIKQYQQSFKDRQTNRIIRESNKTTVTYILDISSTIL